MPLHHRFDDMTWPLPGEEMDQLEWRIRYVGYFPERALSQSDRYVAASIIAAYSELILCTNEKRKHVVAELRKECEE